MAERTALITGISGQDGRIMSGLLSARGYRVIGTSRSGTGNGAAHIPVHHWDLLDQNVIDDIVARERPDEIYNLAAYSSGSGMFDAPVDMAEVNGLAVTRILETIRRIRPGIRFAQASSSEMFGDPVVSPQSEATPFNPRSPYGAAKLYAHTMVKVYRAYYGLFVTSAILFNHESPLRGLQFLTRKVTNAAARAKLGMLDTLELGHLGARRDWGYAEDSMRAMWRMLQVDRADDYVIATGITHSVRDVCAYAFGYLGLDYRDYVTENREMGRTVEATQLAGDAAKAMRDLDWRPTVNFETVIRAMVDSDLAALTVQRQNDGVVA